MHWNVKGRPGADGVNGAQGAVGVAGPTGAAGADGTNGADGSAGPAGPAGHGSMMSGGVFTLQSPGQWADTHAYLPLSGYLGTQVVAPWLDYDAYVIEVEHTSVEQVIPNEVTITDMYANFGSITDLSGRSFQVRLTLLVALPGAPVLVPAGGCLFDVEGNGPTSNDCSWQEDQAVHLSAGDVAVVYVDVSLHGTWDPDSIDVYGSVVLTS